VPGISEALQASVRPHRRTVAAAWAVASRAAPGHNDRGRIPSDSGLLGIHLPILEAFVMRSRRRHVGLVGISLLLVAGLLTPASGAGAAEEVKALTATIDRRIADQWEESRATPAPPADDAEFLRRVALDLTGKIPTVGEVRAFLEDEGADRRERLVERLLDSPGYVTHFTNIERHLLIPEADSSQQAGLLAPSFAAWLREQIAANAGSDRIVRALLTAPVADDRNAQAGRPLGLARFQGASPVPFYVSKDVKSENLAASTARLFLGLRLECAQCHNHPFATWTREQFWSYASFFASLEKRGPADALFSPIRELPDRRESAIPGTDKVVQAVFLDGSEPEWRPRVPARMTLADWMTAPDNPYFARAAVNRMWAHFFGVGLVDPVDDMGADNPPSHPELLDDLAHAFATHGFDRKVLIRALVLSRPYQLTSRVDTPDADGAAATTTGPSADDSRLFVRMPVRGLSAEQLYDSLAQAVGLPAEEVRNDRFAFAGNTPRGQFLERFARHDEKPGEMQTSILQALALMNGPLVAGATQTRGMPGATLLAVTDAPFLDTAGRVEALFLATLSRPPTPAESARLVAYVERADSRKALSDVFWALLNSPEFLLNH
jgi:hypothetical protein